MEINLTYPIHKRMFKYPSDPDVEIEMVRAYVDTEGKYHSGYLTFKNLRNHHGTHIDAPSHKVPNGKTIDQYPIERFIKKCTLIDMTSRNLMQRNNRGITENDISMCFNQKIDQEPAIILYTGFCDEMAKYEGQLTGQAKTDFEKGFPYLTEPAAKYLINKNNRPSLLGIDSFSVDPSGSNSEVHRMLLERDILILETLYNLKELKDATQDAFKLTCVPLAYLGGDAAPVRAYAEI